MNWPTFRIIGGPHGKDTEVWVDGKRIDKVVHVDVSADVNDAIRITTRQLVKIDIEVKGEDVRTYEAVAYLPIDNLDGGNARMARFRATADYAWEAVADIARQMELVLASERRADLLDVQINYDEV